MPYYGYAPFTAAAIGGRLLASGVPARGGYGEIVEPEWRPPRVRVVRPGDRATRPIRRAVWSFWSVPYRRQHGRHWPSDFFHTLSWILSFRLASRLFPTTALVTDDWGHELLVERLRLPFDDVSLSLNELAAQDPSWWALGKLHAYREQDEPFLHIDNDVFLWPGFPAEGLSGEVVAQNPEHAPLSDAGYYRPSAVTAAIRSTGGFLPEEFSGYTGEAALCTGIVGGTAIPLLRRYADLGIRMVESAGNQAAWRRLAPLEDYNLVVEQYLLGALCWGSGVTDVQCVFGSQHDTFREDVAIAQRFTHLIASAKTDLHYMRLLAQRVKNHYPADFEIARRLSGDQ
ncbi:hypothetical protein GCM10027598_16420 [Amycolatopsis oliviviridis]|uniref:DUF6734 domain-containing protein n=1 Tax=Amycolatopsis oliviviridis TaxID=1471590 RepID=A0ABQ3MBY6_9PSEU|nr:DUF6734 family protein [Amycolatopsis oliviviridis]GHH33974.1 hypothetical protein GCM10017790_73180 [Amycolatopsis oliviviridis]